MTDDIKDLIRDAQKISDYWFAMCLVFAGYELLFIKWLGERNYEYTILVPRFDFEELQQDFSQGQMQIADAKELGNTNRLLGRIVNDVKRTGRAYVNPDYARLGVTA
jgi:hypothetical protein